MIYSFSDFLTDNSVIIIVLILGAILGVTYYLKRNVLSKYNPHDDDDQTPEEILQDELDSILVTEKYNPNAGKVKKDILDEDDDDFDYDNNVKKEVEHDDSFTVDTDVSYSFQTFDDNNEK